MHTSSGATFHFLASLVITDAPRPAPPRNTPAHRGRILPYTLSHLTGPSRDEVIGISAPPSIRRAETRTHTRNQRPHLECMDRRDAVTQRVHRSVLTTRIGEDTPSRRRRAFHADASRHRPCPSFKLITPSLVRTGCITGLSPCVSPRSAGARPARRDWPREGKWADWAGASRPGVICAWRAID